MTMDLGSQFVVQGIQGYFTAPNYGLKGLIIANLSPFVLLVYTGLNSKRLYPDTVDWFPVSYGFNGTITWKPQSVVSNPSSYTSSIISFTAVGILESVDTTVYPLALTLPAVNPTASGDPIFSATIGFGSTTTTQQILNIFNPVNSGAQCTFHSARVFTSDNGNGDNGILFMLQGPDNNFPIPTPINNNSGQATPISVCHASASDFGASGNFTVQNEIEVLDTTQNQTVEFLAFPDNKILLPGNNLGIGMFAVNAAKVTRLTTKWTEKISLPILMISPPPPAKPGGLFMPNLTGIYSPLDYGTISGVANDDVAVRKAYNAAVSNGGGWVLMHPLKHVFSSAVQLTANNVGFWGMGWSALVTIPNAGNFYPFVGNAGTNGIIGATFYNFKIDGNGANQTGASGCINAAGFYRSNFELMWFEAPYESGLKFFQGPGGGFGFQNNIDRCFFMHGNASPNAGMGLWISSTDENSVSDCFFQEMGGAGGIDQVSIRDENGLTSYTGCKFVGNGTKSGGIKCYATSQAGIRVIGSVFDGVGGGNIILPGGGGGGTSIIGNRFMNIGFGATVANSVDGIYVAATDVMIEGNWFSPDGGGHCLANVELDGTNGQDYGMVIGNTFAAVNGGSLQIKTDGAPAHNTITPNTLH